MWRATTSTFTRKSSNYSVMLCTKACTSISNIAAAATAPARRAFSTHSSARTSKRRSTTRTSRHRSCGKSTTASVYARLSPKRKTRALAAIDARLALGGRLLALGNGGSATDATDFALDCIAAAPGFAALPALSLAAEPAVLSAIANEVGVELMFARQVIAAPSPATSSSPFRPAAARRTSSQRWKKVARAGCTSSRSSGTTAARSCVASSPTSRPSSQAAISHACIQETQATIDHVLRERLGRGCA